jgi:site-specific DNA-methyltransferase (adenine-specific)
VKITSARGYPWELRLGRYQDALADLTQVDALVGDPPYGERTHSKQDVQAHDGATRRPLNYSCWTRAEVQDYSRFWSPRVRGWMGVMSCSDLAHIWREELEGLGRQVFAPVPCVIRGMTVRLSGDGPSSWAVYLNVARPRAREWIDGTRPGAYVVGRGGRKHIGGKPLDLMLLVVNHYTRPGDLVVDPTAGFATTGAACLGLGRRFIGSEVDPATLCKGAEAIIEAEGKIPEMAARLEELLKKGAACE